MTKLAVIYYSATGHGTAMAKRVAQAGEAAGAEVRVRHIEETRDPETFAHNPAWTANYSATKDLPAATAGPRGRWPTRSTPGYTDPIKFADGNPYGVGHITGPDNQNPLDETTLAALDHLAARVVGVAAKLAGA